VVVARDATIAVKCHGCGVSGDALSLVAAVEGLDLRRDFRAVLARAAALAGIRLDERTPRVTPRRGEPSPSRRMVEPPPPPSPRRDTDEDRAVQRLYASLLEACPLDSEGVAYLEGRAPGLAERAVGWGALPAAARDQSEVERFLVREHGEAAWRASGLARDGGEGFVYSDHRLLIPWRAAGVDGAVVALQRRAMRAPVEREPKYIFGRARAAAYPFGVEDIADEIDSADELVIVEGAMDALAMRALSDAHPAAARVVVGLPGVATWQQHLDFIAKWCAGRRAVVALDADAAGEGVVSAMASALRQRGAAATTRRSPGVGKDWVDALAATALRKEVA
jgi:DNA primase